MALRNNVLYFVYKLNGIVQEIESVDITLSNPDRIFMDKVDMRRSGYHMLPTLIAESRDH